MYPASSFIDKHEEVRAEREQQRLTREENAARRAEGRAIAKAASIETAKRRRVQENKRKKQEQEEERRRQEILAQRKSLYQHHVSQYRLRSEAPSEEKLQERSGRPTAASAATRGKPARAAKTSKNDASRVQREFNQSESSTQPETASAWPFKVRPVPDFARPNYQQHATGGRSQPPESIDIEDALKAIGAAAYLETGAQMTHSSEIDIASSGQIASHQHHQQQLTADTGMYTDSPAEDSPKYQVSAKTTTCASRVSRDAEEMGHGSDETDDVSAEDEVPSEVEAEVISVSSSSTSLSPLKHPATQHLFKEPATISLETSEMARRKLCMPQRPPSANAWEPSSAKVESSVRTEAVPNSIASSELSDSLEMLSMSDGSDTEVLVAKDSRNTNRQSALSQGFEGTGERIEHGPRQPTPYPSVLPGMESPREEPVELSKTTSSTDLHAELPSQLRHQVAASNHRHASDPPGQAAAAAAAHTATLHGPAHRLSGRGRSQSLHSIQPNLRTGAPHSKQLSSGGQGASSLRDPIPRGILKRTEQQTVSRGAQERAAGFEGHLSRMSRARSDGELVLQRRIKFLDHEVILNEGDKHTPPAVHRSTPIPRHQAGAGALQGRVRPPTFNPSNALFLAAQRQKAQRQRQQRSQSLADMDTPASSTAHHVQQTQTQQRIAPVAASSTTPGARNVPSSPQLHQRRSSLDYTDSLTEASDDMIWNQVRRCLSNSKQDRTRRPAERTRVAAPAPAPAVPSVSMVQHSNPQPPPHVRLRKQSPGPATATANFEGHVVGHTFYHAPEASHRTDLDPTLHFNHQERRSQPALSSGRPTNGYRKAMVATNSASYSRMLEHYDERMGDGIADADYLVAGSHSGSSVGSTRRTAGKGRPTNHVITNPELDKQEKDIMEHLQHIESLLNGKKGITSSSVVPRRPTRGSLTHQNSRKHSDSGLSLESKPYATAAAAATPRVNCKAVTVAVAVAGLLMVQRVLCSAVL
eukprot:scpid33843/ scgid20245/ 